ncbi:MAG: hypothetical protein LBD36_03335 [Holosporales bacterium]|jgi:hypothetical protein|nr:hypothetical protein [Holosporales bacterium]
MNNLSVYVEKNNIDISIYCSKRITVRYNSTDIDLDLILNKYNISWASVILDVTVVDCEFIPVDKLFFHDKFSLKKSLKKKSTTLETLLIGPKYIKYSNNKKFALTTCNLSTASQRILQQIIQYKIPLRKVDIAQNLISRNAMKNASIKTKWCCVIYKSNEHITLAVYLNAHLVIVREVEDPSEILQTFQYLSRSSYTAGDAITILHEKDLDWTLHESISTQLNCARFDSFIANRDFQQYIYHPKTSFLHNMYLLPKCTGLAAVSCSSLAILASIHNYYIFHSEKCNQVQSQNSTYCASQDEISLLENQLNQKKMLIALSEYKASQNWSQQYSLQVLFAVFAAAHKGQFLNMMSCEIHGTNLVITVELSPFAIYKDSNKGRIVNILHKYSKETLAITKNALAENFDKTFNAKTEISSKNICLKISFSENDQRDQTYANVYRLQYNEQ